MIRIALVLLLLFSNCVAQTNTKAPTPAALDQRLTAFVSSFDDLDWQRFRPFFADDATVFHPAAPNLKRTDSRESFEQAWLGVFERIRKNSRKSAPPYMQLQPKDLRIQYLDKDVALVTFHLDDGEVFGRRTMVWQRQAGEWRIVHIHASNFNER
ncbi:hypothetical protein Acid345_3597 [Candidatus Koribacter versatilis Ellin345]|uniref:SnoaL-like domain-containing protein n=1 Tax=Koribacter versatilis (strain Ellin345) TaxID=204669 RepID=Q1IKK2_KORVE|nr:nuclear transport factor 2 family protein [Candidatus Koribacter versatilis]ABF42598.1 hypothetical protein Acid345_3597 [Candidatus Koribacter versatilis Ellin345]